MKRFKKNYPISMLKNTISEIVAHVYINTTPKMLNNEGGVILVLILLPTYTFAEIPFTLIKVLDGNFSFYGSEMIVKKDARYKVVTPNVFTSFDCLSIEEG